MAVNPAGVYGTDISWPRAVISSLPVIGPIMNFVNLPYIWLSCCFDSPIEPIEKEHSEVRVARVNAILSLANDNTLNREIEQRSKNLNDRNIQLIRTLTTYSACGLIANLLTLGLNVSLVALAILTGPWMITALVTPAVFSLVNAFVMYNGLEALR